MPDKRNSDLKKKTENKSKSDSSKASIGSQNNTKLNTHKGNSSLNENFSDSSNEAGSGKEVPEVKVGFWNIEGLYEKLNFEGLCDFLQTFDILGLGETFTLPGFDFGVKLPDHVALHCPAKKYSKLGRPSGGLVLLIRKTLAPFIEIVETNLSHVLAIKIKKSLLNTAKDLLLVTIYNHPKESIFYKNKQYYSTLEETEQFLANNIEEGKDCDIIINGDLNARVGDWAYTEEDSEDLDWGERPYTYTRQSQDQQLNGFGKILIELCTSFGLTPIAGLVERNFSSAFTFLGHRGSSLVDHFIVSVNILDYIINYAVINRIESNHLPIVLTLKKDKSFEGTEKDEENESTIKMKWQESKEKECLNILKKKATQNLLQLAEDQLDSNMEESINSFNKAMDATNKPMKQTIKVNRRKISKNAWFDKDCKSSKKRTSNLLHKLNNINRLKKQEKYDKIKKEYLAERLKYNKLIKEKRKAYKKETQDKLLENRKDSKKFWDLIKKINFKTLKMPKIKITEWGKYFYDLLNPKTTKQKEKDNLEQDTTEINEIIVEDLDKEITKAEVLQAIDKQKNGKSAGLDDISPDLIKLAKPHIVNYLHKLFQKIFDTSKYPKEWAKSIIIPIHKKGSRLLFDNYRGISLLSVTSKLFTSIINNRLYSWMENNMKICEEQAGFRRHFSTVDHIYTLYSMVNNRLHGQKRGKLYVAFIDFKKAFDTVDRNVLWECMKEEGISNKMIKMVKGIYNIVTATVRFNNKYSEDITCPLGVKQGCLLSPLLFSILINKVARKIAEKGRAGYQFITGGKEIFSLLFADDIVLVSLTPSGLQNQINILKTESEKLGLEVNLNKSKSMIFRGGGYIGKAEKWFYGQEKIENVNSYKYLGYTFTTKLSTEIALAEFAGRAKGKVISIFKALYKIGKIDISIFFHLFDCQVKPMILYASEIWGNNVQYSLEKVHMFAARKLIGVSSKTPRQLVYGELNRYPLVIDSKIKTLKYWLKLQEMEDNRIPKQAYMRDEKEMHINTHSWSREIKNMLERNGYGYIWINKGTMFTRSFLKSFKQRLVDQFWQEWHQKITEKDRFTTYSSIKEDHNCEKYLSNINITKFRKIFTKLRLGILDLNNNKKFYDKNAETKCHCGYEKEDELHFLLDCPSYAFYRSKYITKHWPDRDKVELKDLLSNLDEEKKQDLAMYTFYSCRRKECITAD